MVELADAVGAEEVSVGDEGGDAAMLADLADLLVEVGMEEWFASAEGDDFGAEGGEEIDATKHLYGWHWIGDLVVFVAVCAGEIAAANGNDVGEDGMVARLERAGDHARLTKAARQGVDLAESPCETHRDLSLQERQETMGSVYLAE